MTRAPARSPARAHGSGVSSVRRGPRARAQAGRKGFLLTITEGRNAGREYYFEHESSLGRTDENNVVIIDPGVSRRHARISGADAVYTIEDLGSSNGTRLNGERLAGPEVLRDGDYLQIGETTILFSVLDVANVDVTARTSFAGVEHAAADLGYTGQRSLWRLRLRRLMRDRRMQAVLGLLSLLAVAAWVYVAIGGGRTPIVVDRSNEVIPYSDEDLFFNRVFGLGAYDKTHREKAEIEFQYHGGRATLQYGAWGLDKVGEVHVLLNGTKIAESPVTMSRWVYGIKVLLPRQVLKRGSNMLVFKHTLNPPGRDPWEVCYVQILQEAIPPPNLEEARLQFSLAKKAYDDRGVAVENLFEALQKFRRARDLMEDLPQKPDIYGEALDYIEKADQMLTGKFQDALFEARRAERFSGVEEACKILRRALAHFARDDFRYRELKRQIDRYEM